MKADRVLDHRDLVKLPSFRIRTDEKNSCCAHSGEDESTRLPRSTNQY